MSIRSGSGSGAHWVSRVAFYVSGVLTGIALQMNWLAHRWDPTRGTLFDFAASGEWTARGMASRLWAGALFVPLALFGLRAITRWVVARGVGREPARAYRRHDSWPYVLFSLTFLGAFGIHADPVLLLVLFGVWQGAWLLRVSPQLLHRISGVGRGDERAILALFLVSGFAALVYQVVWQRALFQSFGVNIESVTVIVSVFMLGLGLGSLFGGWLSAKWPNHLVHLFVGCELAIGIFGWFSLGWIGWLARTTLGSSLPVVAAATFGLLCVPTLFMGATLPILVTRLHRTQGSVGPSLSLLYSINTLGSAIASFLCVHLLFLYLGLEGAARVGALFNLGVAWFGYRLVRSGRGAGSPPDGETVVRGEPAPADRAWGYGLILLVSFTVGFVALSLEILWIRMLSFATGSRAVVFGNLLGCYLLGIALGALLAKRLCAQGSAALPAWVARFLILAAGSLYIAPPLVAELMTWIGVAAVPFLYLGAGAVAMLTGAVFPLLCHLAVVRSESVGPRVSGVYFANILGATAGPLVTGFYLLEWSGIERNVLHFATLTLGLGLALALVAPRAARLPRRWSTLAGLGLLAGLLGYPVAYGALLEKLCFHHKYRGSPAFSRTVQNRSGIVGVVPQAEGDDIMIGGGVFDGRFSTSLTLNRNKIDRAYMVGALHPEPSRVLEIGLSSGSWARVFLNHAAVAAVHVIEINPGYLQIVERYPESRSALDDPRTEVFIDDARRWLLRHPDERYDVIVMNTTFYWRSQVNNLLSREFIALCRAHLRPGGVLYINTTGCADAYYTAARGFPFVVQYQSFVAGSERPFTEDARVKLERLARFSYQGQPILEWEGGRLKPLIEKLAHSSTADRKVALEGMGPVAQLATDDNLGTEFKVGRRIYAPARGWWRLLSLWRRPP